MSDIWPIDEVFDVTLEDAKALAEIAIKAVDPLRVYFYDYTKDEGFDEAYKKYSDVYRSVMVFYIDSTRPEARERDWKEEIMHSWFEELYEPFELDEYDCPPRNEKTVLFRKRKTMTIHVSLMTPKESAERKAKLSEFTVIYEK